MKRGKRRLALTLAMVCIGATLAACNAADAPRGGPQLPSTPAFLSGGSNSPSPSGALPASVPELPVVGGVSIEIGAWAP